MSVFVKVVLDFVGTSWFETDPIFKMLLIVATSKKLKSEN